MIGDPGQTHSGVACGGQDGQCSETFTITETSAPIYREVVADLGVPGHLAGPAPVLVGTVLNR